MHECIYKDTAPVKVNMQVHMIIQTKMFISATDACAPGEAVFIPVARSKQVSFICSSTRMHWWPSFQELSPPGV